MPNEWQDELPPASLVLAFERCANYPRDAEGVIVLIDGLRNASIRAGIEMSKIVNRCVQSSEWCPTDHDLFTVAAELRAEERQERESKRNRWEEWRIETGPPREFDWKIPGWDQVERHNDRQRKLWSDLRRKLNVTDGKWPSWSELAVAARQLGYAEYADAWERNR